jgi:hypothetical protein
MSFSWLLDNLPTIRNAGPPHSRDPLLDQASEKR